MCCEDCKRNIELYQLKEDSTTNGSQGTVSQKVQTFVDLFIEWCEEPYQQNRNSIGNPHYKDNIDWKTFLTTTVENLHAVSHFKHETFDAL